MPTPDNRIYATGKRKSAVARVWLSNGSGQFIVNNTLADDYFERETTRMIARQSLELLEAIGDFDVWATVKGGGITGQAGALRHGLARALVVANEDYRKPLRKNGYLTRDSRMVERKKPGRRKARRRFQFSKR